MVERADSEVASVNMPDQILARKAICSALVDVKKVIRMSSIELVVNQPKLSTPAFLSYLSSNIMSYLVDFLRNLCRNFYDD